MNVEGMNDRRTKTRAWIEGRIEQINDMAWKFAYDAMCDLHSELSLDGPDKKAPTSDSLCELIGESRYSGQWDEHIDRIVDETIKRNTDPFAGGSTHE